MPCSSAYTSRDGLATSQLNASCPTATRPVRPSPQLTIRTDTPPALVHALPRLHSAPPRGAFNPPRQRLHHRTAVPHRPPLVPVATKHSQNHDDTQPSKTGCSRRSIPRIAPPSTVPHSTPSDLRHEPRTAREYLWPGPPWCVGPARGAGVPATARQGSECGPRRRKKWRKLRAQHVVHVYSRRVSRTCAWADRQRRRTLAGVLPCVEMGMCWVDPVRGM